MKPITVLSLFDGMSCGRIALERAGIPVDRYYAAEIDKYAIKVSNANYPDIIRLGDVRDVKAEDLPDIDLLLAGSPCQGFSFAGTRLEFNDPRSSLFFEFVRILKEVKPKKFLLENVVMSQECNDVISCILGEIYPECVDQKQIFQPGRLEPIKINSALVSAQNRNRLYWTNIEGVEQPEDRGILLEDILEDGSNTVYQRGRGNNPGGVREGKSPCMGSSAWQQNVKVITEELQKDNPRVAGVSVTEDGIRPYRDDEKKSSLSEFGTIAFPGSKSNACIAGHPPKVARTKSVMLTERRTDEAKNIRSESMKKGKDFSPRRGKELVPRSDDKSNCLTTSLTKEHIIVKVPVIKQDGELIYKPHKSQCLDANYFKGPDNHGQRTGIIFLEGMEKGRRLDDGKKLSRNYSEGYRIHSTKGKAVTLSASSKGGPGGQPGLYSESLDAKHWRKLSCIECERLQTVEDNYTNHVSNSQRYKMLGNGWTIEVIAHILGFLKLALEV